jgi:predicted flap endonuclease-1-like 5' DNA nuclease
MKEELAREREEAQATAGEERRAFLEGVRSSVQEILSSARQERDERRRTTNRAANGPRTAAAEHPPSTAPGPGEASPTAATADAYPDASSSDDEAPATDAPDAESGEAEASNDAESEDAATDSPASQDTADNLAEIQGIGPKMAFRLREAGILTFEDMAASTSDEIRDMMGGLPSFADVDSWIEQAKEKTETDE